MKKKQIKLNKKLLLAKKTIAGLTALQQEEVEGGNQTYTCITTQFTDEPCDPPASRLLHCATRLCPTSTCPV